MSRPTNSPVTLFTGPHYFPGPGPRRTAGGFPCGAQSRKSTSSSIRTNASTTPHPSLTMPEARIFRHIQMIALITPPCLFLCRSRSDHPCPNCPAAYADLPHCFFYCPMARLSSSLPFHERLAWLCRGTRTVPTGHPGGRRARPVVLDKQKVSTTTTTRCLASKDMFETSRCC